MLRKRSITQTAFLTWSGDTTISADIDQVGHITQIDFTVEVTPSATLAGANQPDGLFRVIQNLAVKGGSHTYIDLPADDGCGGGVLLHYLNAHDYPGKLFHHSGAITAPSRTYQPITYVVHSGTRPQKASGLENKFDLTGFIPASTESQLRLEWTVSGNDVMDDTVTISSATGRVTLHYVTGSEEDIRNEMAAQGVLAAMCPAWRGQRHTHDSTYGNYSDEINIPTGAYLSRVSLLAQDATASRTLRAMDEWTGVQVKLNNDEILIQAFADAIAAKTSARGTFLMADDADDDFAGEAIYGFGVLDLKDHAVVHGPNGNLLSKDWGVNLIGVPQGLPKLGLTVTTYTSGDDTLILWERHLPFNSVSGMQGASLATKA